MAWGHGHSKTALQAPQPRGLVPRPSPTPSGYQLGHPKASLFLEGGQGLSGPGHCRQLADGSSLSLQGAQTLTASPPLNRGHLLLVSSYWRQEAPPGIYR